MVRVRSSLVVWLLTAFLLALVPRPALACSCAIQDPEVALADAEAAFVGTLQAQRGEEWTFEVQSVLAGDLPSSFTFRAAVGDGANCGLRVSPGDRYGLLMYREADGSLSSNGCLEYDAQALLAAGDPRPPSDATEGAVEGEPASSDDGGGGAMVLLATVLGAAAVLGGVALWARRQRV